MLRKAALPVLLVLPFLLAGCGMLDAGPRLSASISPTTLGFEITDQGLEFATPNVTFTNSANAPAARITGYEVRFYGDGGSPFPDVSNSIYNYRLVNVSVPAGYMCPDADEESGIEYCGLGERIPWERDSEPVPFIMVPGTVGMEIVERELTSVRAVVTFFADQAGRRVTWDGEISVTYPVRDEE